VNPRADTANRIVLAVLGLLLVAGAGAGLAAGLGAWGSVPADRPILDPRLRDFSERHGWLWAVVAAAGLVVAGLACRWLGGQLHTDRVRILELESDPRTGETTIPTSALTDAVATEIAGYRGVRHVTARTIGTAAHPRTVLHVELADRAPIGEVRRRIDDEAIAHLRTALQDPGLPVQLELAVAPLTRGRPATPYRPAREPL
jgi:hypothetical protein